MKPPLLYCAPGESISSPHCENLTRDFFLLPNKCQPTWQNYVLRTIYNTKGTICRCTPLGRTQNVNLTIKWVFKEFLSIFLDSSCTSDISDIALSKKLKNLIRAILIILWSSCFDKNMTIRLRPQKLCAGWEVCKTRNSVGSVISQHVFMDVSCKSKRPIVFRNYFNILKKSKWSLRIRVIQILITESIFPF